ncbi:MAG TPA: universal stress protein [Candidatus Baltobacteraceae bacterium]|jgi:nucleotide-binding universal stress UspA family protein|nr:universal stress protein [Candidatus Baltobacteraceae bacterium]
MRVLVPLDGSETSERALEVAAGFAATIGAEIVACHIVDLARAAAMSGGEGQLVAGCLDALRDEGRSILKDAEQRVAGRVKVTGRIVDGAPVEAIEKLAKEISASFIVLGSHGRSGLTRLVLGSVAEGVVRAAHVPVMVVPHNFTALS